MGSTNKTTNLELSQFLATDSPKWLTDYNSDMEKIDVGYSGVKTQADATDLNVSGLSSTVTSLSESVSDQSTAIATLRTDVTGNTGNINTINSLIGNGEPTTTDKTLIGAINELHASQVSDENAISAIQSAISTFEDDIEALESGKADNIGLNSTYTTVSQSVSYNSSYTVPADGMYIINLASSGTNAAIIFSDSARTNVIAAGVNTLIVPIPLKKNMVIYTRNDSSTSYAINGYYS